MIVLLKACCLVMASDSTLFSNEDQQVSGILDNHTQSYSNIITVTNP